RIEKIDWKRERPGKPVLVAVEGPLATGVARRRPLHYHRGPQLLAFGLLVVRAQRGSRYEALDAAAPPAITLGPGEFVGVHPGHRNVPPFAGNAVGTAQRATIDDDPAAGAGAEHDAEHRPVAAAGAVAGLRKREAGRIVLEAQFAPEQLLE